MRADTVEFVEGSTEAPRSHAKRRGLTGVREQGMYALGFPRNLGGLAASTDEKRKGGKPRNNLQARGEASLTPGSEEGTLGRYR